MSVKQTVGIRVDGGGQFGFGHLVRMLVLAKSLKQRGARAVFYTTRGSVGVKKIRAAGFTVRLLPVGREERKARSLIRLLAADQVKRLAVDLPVAISLKTARVLRQAKLPIVLIDDLGLARRQVDLTINAIDHMPYRSVARGRGRVLEGPSYMIVADNITRAAPVSVRQHARRLLLTFGGSDVANLTTWTLKALLPLVPNVSITCLLGPDYQHGQELRRMADRYPHHVKLVESHGSIIRLLRQADLVFTHMGLTGYELARLGVPVVQIHPTRYHDGVGRVFARRGSVVNFGFFKDVTPATVRRRVKSLLDDWRARQRMNVRGQRIVDGRGSQRIASLILETKRRA